MTLFHVVADIDPEFWISWENTYQVLECQECEHVTVRIRHWNDEAQFHPERKDYQDTYYPPIVSRPKPYWFSKLDPELQEVLDEVYIALDANTRFLAAFGARTALDMMIVDKIGDIGSFKEKLNKFESGGYVNSTEKELLDAVTEAGNAAAHRGYAPEEKLLNRYAENKWNIKEILVHLIDYERIFAYRALRYAINNKTPLPGFEEKDYAIYSKANERSLDSIFEEYESVRKATLTLFNYLPEESFLRSGACIDDDGSIINKRTVRALVYHIAGHELRHLNIIKQRYLD